MPVVRRRIVIGAPHSLLYTILTHYLYYITILHKNPAPLFDECGLIFIGRSNAAHFAHK